MNTNKYNNLARKAILDLIKKNDDVSFPEEGYSYYRRTFKNIIKDYALKNDIHLTNDDINQCIETLKEDKYFKYVEDKDGFEIDNDLAEDLMWESSDHDIITLIKVPLNHQLKHKLKHKYNIAIDTIKDNIVEIAASAGVIVVVSSMFVGGICFANQQLDKFDKYQNSILIDHEKNYRMNDIYIVYSADNVYFCTRNIHKITKGDKVYGDFMYGGGNVDEYYYRDEIYDYYDIKTGNKICSDHEDGFYIEELLDFYDKDKMEEKNYKIDLEEVTKDINNDYLLSRDPGLKRK